METCPNHSGLKAEIDNMKEWQNEHMKNVHTEIKNDITSLQTRLPLWATFVIAFLSSIATWGLTH